MHPDRAYGGAPTQALLDRLGFVGAVARKGVPAPLQVGKRWIVERTQAWMNGYGDLRRCTDRDGAIVGFFLAAAFVTARALLRATRQTHRWSGRRTTRRLKIGQSGGARVRCLAPRPFRAAGGAVLP